MLSAPSSNNTCTLCRYHVKVKLDKGHLVLGQVTKGSALSDWEVAAIHQLVPYTCTLESALVNGRVLLAGVLYTPT